MRLSINYQGRVQGVGFRFTAQEVVRRQPFPLTGWVRNEPDGSVQMELQGEPAAVEAALNDLHSIMSRNIRQTDRTTIPETSNEHAFTITY
jgi:acylphosphatase